MLKQMPPRTKFHKRKMSPRNAKKSPIGNIIRMLHSGECSRYALTA